MQSGLLIPLALIIVVVVTPGASAQVDAGSEAANASASISDVFVFGTEERIQPASSSLIRTTNGVSVTVNTSALNPGYVYTMWWVFFPNPNKCGSIPCGPGDLFTPAVQAVVAWADGRVANAYGQAVFTGHAVPGDPEGVVVIANDDVTGFNPKKAEAHQVIRCHGPVDEQILHAQLTTLNAGCEALKAGDEFCGVDIETAGMCPDVQDAIHLP